MKRPGPFLKRGRAPHMCQKCQRNGAFFFMARKGWGIPFRGAVGYNKKWKMFLFKTQWNKKVRCSEWEKIPEGERAVYTAA